MKTNALNSLVVMTLGLILLAPGRLMAHAFLDHADPKVGSTIDQPPSQVKIWFTQELEPAFSGMKVTSSEGVQVDRKDARVHEKEKNLMIVSLTKLPPGTYKVSWHAVSVDTHRTQGDFKFTVGS
jgi:methionine-rich copper-binding protein CopC